MLTLTFFVILMQRISVLLFLYACTGSHFYPFCKEVLLNIDSMEKQQIRNNNYRKIVSEWVFRCFAHLRFFYEDFPAFCRVQLLIQYLFFFI